MGPGRVRDLLRGGGVAVNGWLAGDSPYLAETLSYAGFDCITVDLQHGMFGVDRALELLRAVSAGPAEPFARPSSSDAAVIGKLLDGGAYGIICPNVDTPDQAAALVAACRYPPVGNRSYGPARAALGGGKDLVATANRELLVWAMIESRQALEAVDEIAAVPGLDGLFVGPSDLAVSLGEPVGVPTPPQAVEDAWVRIREAAHQAGLYAGTFCADAAVAARLAGDGYDLVTPGNDATQLRGAATAAVSVVRDRLGAAGSAGT